MRVGIRIDCAVCGKQKCPVGRSAPLESYLCDWECDGYRLAPFVGSLWPGESEVDFGFPVGPDGTKEVSP